MTSASQVHALAQSGERHIVQIRLGGTVYGVDRRHQALALKDDSGFVWLERVAFPESVVPGTKVTVEGLAALGIGQALLAATPVVEQDWNAGNAARAGFIYLNAGQHPYELTYYQGVGAKRLDVFYEGPVSYTNLPADALFCADPAGTDRLIPGVRFELFAGAWNALPDCGKLQPIQTGITTNFAPTIGGAETNFALRFSGSLQVPQAGEYRFAIAADDGARLFIHYNSTNQVRATGQSALIAPVTIQPGQPWPDQTEPFFAEVEGVVKELGRYGDQLQMELASELGGRMQVTVSDGTEAMREFLLQSRVRVRGLCQGAVGPAGNKLAGYLRAPSMNDVTITQPAEMLWIANRLCAISNLTTFAPSDSIVHLQGTVAEVVPGQYLVLDDGTGQIRVPARQGATPDPGTKIAVLGKFSEARELIAAVWRSGATFQEGMTLPTLTTIEQVRHLKLEESGQRFPVNVRGVVTYVFTGGYRAHVQGEREGLYVAGPSSSPVSLRVGDLCQFTGNTSTGLFSRIIVFQTATVLGKGQVPEPLRPTWAQLMNGSLDADWVEIQGVVQRVRDRDMFIAMRGGVFMVRFFHPDVSDLPQYQDAVVRVRGTVRAMANRTRQVRTVYLQVASPLQITVDEAAPADPFDIPAKQVAELRQFDPDAAIYRRVRTEGQVIHFRGLTGYLMDGTNGLRFTLRESTDLVPGDGVEVVGLPELEGLAPALGLALARAMDRTDLPTARPLLDADLLSRFNDATRVRVEGTLLAFRTNRSDQVLDMQTGTRLYQARLARGYGLLPELPVGGVVRIDGTYAGQGLDDTGENVQSFELLLNSPADVAVLVRPSWWTMERMFAVVGGMALVLGVAVVWITLLRRQVEARTRALRDEVDSHKRTETELAVEKTKLESEIEERKRIEKEVEQTHRQLLDVSRKAGQAEVASNVLHNVGNVLNSVNVSSGVITDRIRGLRLNIISKVAELMEQNQSDLGRWIVEDEKGRQLPAYLKGLGRQLQEQQSQIVEEVRALSQNVDHIKEIVAMQQNYARVSGVEETLTLTDIVESALKMEAGGYTRHGVSIVRDYAEVPPVTVDKHKVLQIVVNILHNAKYACDESQRPDKTVTIRIQAAPDDRLRLEIADNGVGIPEENLKRMFTHGFTTRKTGHGFGLHGAALAAKQLGGTLSVHSEGLGKGAAFVFEIPRQKDG